jgi:hypothetical protein
LKNEESADESALDGQVSIRRSTVIERVSLKQLIHQAVKEVPGMTAFR